MLRSRGRGRGGSGGAWYFQDKADGVDPTLNLDFINNRYAVNGVEAPFADVFTFTRASIGTYYDSSGVLQTATADTPRFDYDPVTHAPKGFLGEEARTNLLTRSSEFENAAWSKSSVTITANTTDSSAPDGSSTADKLIATAQTGTHVFYQPYTFTTGVVYTFSIYAKYSNHQYIALRIYDSVALYITFDLLNGTITNQESGITGKIDSVGNGWYRLAATRTATASAVGNFASYFSNTSAYFGGVWAPTGTESVLLWGAQAEASAFPTSYIPTTTAAVTRAADVLTVPTGGWFGSSSGSFFGQFAENSAQNTGTSRIMGTSFAGRFVYRLSGGLNYQIYDGTNIVTAVAQPLNSSVKVASSYGLGGLAISSNGTAPVTGAFDGTWGDQGFAWIATNFTGTIAKYKYYPVQVSDTELQRITT